MIIQENKLIESFKPQENTKVACYAFYILHMSIIPRINNTTLKAFPSTRTICKDTGLSRPTVDSCLDYLQKQGIVKIHKQYDPITKQHKASQYSIETDLIKIK